MTEAEKAPPMPCAATTGRWPRRRRGTFALCPVCGWEDDAFKAKHPDFGGGTNAVSLNSGRRNFQTLESRTRGVSPGRGRPTAEERGA